MNFEHRKRALKKAVLEKQLAHYLALGLLISNVLLCFLAFRSEEKWVLIPQYDTGHRVVLTTEGYSDDYFKDLAHSSLINLLTVHSGTVDRQVMLFREFLAAHSKAEAYLQKHKKYIKENAVSMAFFPKDYAVDQRARTITVSGDLKYWFGGSKTAITKKAVFVLTYIIANKGLILIQDLTQKKEEEEKE